MEPQSRRYRLRTVFAANVRHARGERGWSQEKLGEAAHLSQVYISQVENAGRALSIDSIEKIAVAFGVTAAELLTPRQR
jgi:transcriptional regulator with XRE-family HTH domain